MEFTDQELKAIKAEFCPGFTDDQFSVFITFCRVRNLLPGKHVVAQIRKSNAWDAEVGAKVKTEKVVFITTIDAARLIAQRSNEYKGQAPEQYIYLDEKGMPSVVSEIPLPHPDNRQLPREPWAVRTSVYRKGFDHPITSVARFDAYAVTRRSGDGLVLTEIWSRRSPEMLAKCCEMLSLRKCFPEELSNLYLDSEMKSDSEDEKPRAETVPVVVVPAPPAVPAVNQVPATPTSAPRPTDADVPAPQTEVVTAVVSPQPPVSAPVEKKEEKTRKPRAKKEQPPASDENTITDEDVEAIVNSTPEDLSNQDALRKDARAAIEEATSFTVDEAVEQGLPAPPDPIPSKEEMTAITAHVRELAAAGASNSNLRDYFLKTGDKTDPKFLSKGEWAKAFVELDKAKAEGTLKEFVKQK